MQLLTYPIPHDIELSDYITLSSMLHRYATTRAKSREHLMTGGQTDLKTAYTDQMVFQIKNAIGLGMLAKMALKKVKSKIEKSEPHLSPDLEKLIRGATKYGIKKDKKLVEILSLDPPFHTNELEDHFSELKEINLRFFCEALRVCKTARIIFHADLSLVANIETISDGMTHFFIRNVPKSLRGEYNRRKKPHFPLPLGLDCAGPSR